MRRSVLVASGALVLLALLVSAAFVGARMLRASDEETEPESRGKVMEMMTNDGSGPVSQRITILPAPELPDRPAEASGVFVRRQDNSIFVGTGDITLNLLLDGSTGERTVGLDHSGPEIEVVVNRDTVIYRDETDMSGVNPGAGKSGERNIQQVIEPVDSLDEINDQTELGVWGEQRGDRVVAEVLVYHIVDDLLP